MSTYKWKRNTNFAYEPAKKTKGKKLATVNAVKRIVGTNVDKNYVDYVPASASAVINGVSNAGRVIDLFATHPDLVTMSILDMSIRFRIDLPYIAGQTRCSSRVILFQWKDATAPTVSLVLAGGTGITRPYLQNNSQKRLHILHDKIYNNTELDKPTNTVTLNMYRSKFKKLVNETGTASYNLFALVLSESTTVTFELLGAHTFIKV